MRYVKTFIGCLLLVAGVATANEYYQATGAPSTNSPGSSAIMRAEYALIQAALDKLPTLTGNENEVVKVNSGGTGLESVPVSEMLTTGGVENTANKDASGGYAGLTLRKINFKNVLGTFTSFFTNSNTAARTYTFQDKDGTVADLADVATKADAAATIVSLATKAPIISPALEGTPTAPTAQAATGTTQIANTEWVQSEIDTGVTEGLATLPQNRGRKNYLINGNFDIWEYPSTTQTTSGYGSDNRWVNQHSGDTKTHSRGTFSTSESSALESTPTYYSRTTVTSVAAVGNYTLKEQRIHDVRRLSNKTVTVSFYAKAGTAGKKIGVNFYQDFGSGGSESSPVYVDGQSVNLSTSLTYHQLTFFIPSTTGKTIANGNDSFTALRFWFSAGTNYNTQTASIGHQSDTFDLATVQVEEGNVATAFERRFYTEEQDLSRWFYRRGDQPVIYIAGGASARTAWYDHVDLGAPMRVAPSVTLSGWTYYSNSTAVAMPSPSTSQVTTTSFAVVDTGMTNCNGLTGQGTWTASAEL
jgi:hypothetical protein